MAFVGIGMAVIGAQRASAEEALPAANSAETDQLQEVVVTSQKRAERLQEVPIAIEAFSAAALSNNNVRNSGDLQVLVPGLIFQKTLDVAIPSLRGDKPQCGQCR